MKKTSSNVQAHSIVRNIGIKIPSFLSLIWIQINFFPTKCSRQKVVVKKKEYWPGGQYRKISTSHQPISMRYLAYRLENEFRQIVIYVIYQLRVPYNVPGKIICLWSKKFPKSCFWDQGLIFFRTDLIAYLFFYIQGELRLKSRNRVKFGKISSFGWKLENKPKILLFS